MSQSHSYAPREGKTLAEVFPHHPTKGLESVVSFPRGYGAEPSQKMILCIFQVRKKPSGTPFSVFLSDGVAEAAGPGKTFPLPLSTGLLIWYNSQLFFLRPCSLVAGRSLKS